MGRHNKIKLYKVHRYLGAGRTFEYLDLLVRRHYKKVCGGGILSCVQWNFADISSTLDTCDPMIKTDALSDVWCYIKRLLSHANSPFPLWQIFTCVSLLVL